jgi:hypothetical protein
MTGCASKPGCSDALRRAPAMQLQGRVTRYEVNYGSSKALVVCNVASSIPSINQASYFESGDMILSCATGRLYFD